MELPENNAGATPRWAGLKTRALSGVALAAGVLAILWLGGWMFTLLIMIAAMLMIKEWNALNETQSASWRLAGFAYVAIPCASLIWLRDSQLPETPQAGFALVLYILLLVWATDIGAYFAGRRFGKHKLAPAISPGKTWEGLAGGMLAAGTVSALGVFYSPFPHNFLQGFALGCILATVAQGGDLFESWLKRRAGVKDSGSLIPGHGGILDRVDGLIFTVPLFAWLFFTTGMQG